MHKEKDLSIVIIADFVLIVVIVLVIHLAKPKQYLEEQA
jgi:hypothetical protein